MVEFNEKIINEMGEKLDKASSEPIKMKHELISIFKKLEPNIKELINIRENALRVKEIIEKQAKIVMINGVLSQSDIEIMRRLIDKISRKPADRTKSMKIPSLLKPRKEIILKDKQKILSHFLYEIKKEGKKQPQHTQEAIFDIICKELQKVYDEKKDNETLRKNIDDLIDKMASVMIFHKIYLKILRDQWNCANNIQIDLNDAFNSLSTKVVIEKTTNDYFRNDREIFLTKIQTEIIIHKKWHEIKSNLNVIPDNLNNSFAKLEEHQVKVKNELQQVIDNILNDIDQGYSFKEHEFQEMEDIGLINEVQKRMLANELLKKSASKYTGEELKIKERVVNTDEIDNDSKILAKWDSILNRKKKS